MKEKVKHASIPQICENCGAVMIKKNHCLVCGAQKGKLVAPHTDAVSSEDTSPISPGRLYRQRRFTRFISVIFVLILVASSFGVGAFEYITFQRLNGIYNTNQSVVYQQQNGLLKINMLSSDKSFVLDKYYNNNTNFLKVDDSHDNRFIAYLGNQNKSGYGVKGNLLLTDLISLKDKKDAINAEKTLIFDKEVVDFKFMPTDDILVFLTVEGELYRCDYNKLAALIPSARTFALTLVDSEVGGLISISNNHLLYYKGGVFNADILEHNRALQTGSPFDLYSSNIKGEPYSQLIDSGIYDIADSTDDFSSIIYTKQTKNLPQKEYSVHLYQNQTEPLVSALADNITYLVEANAARGSLMYLNQSQFPFELTDFFDDDLAASDQILQDPSELEELPEGIEITEDEAYQAMLTDYSIKLKRDQLRNQLNVLFSKIDQSTHLSYDLFYIPDSKSEALLVGENILGFNGQETAVFSQLETGYALFVSSTEKTVVNTKLSSLTEDQINAFLDSEYTIEQLVSEGVAESLMLYSASSGTSSLVYSEKGDRIITDYSISVDKPELYFFSKEEYGATIGTLYSANFTNDSVAQLVYIDEYVYAAIGNFQGENPGLIYQTASKDDPPEYIIYDYYSSNIMQIATKTSAANYSEILGSKKDHIYFFRNYDKELGYGNLYVYQTGEDFVASEIAQYQLLSNNELILLQNNSDTLTLLHLKNGRLKTIDQSIKTYHSFDNSFYP